ncbi:holin-like protein [Clostridium cavendishii DSM 21758]|uniref:Holin-like protein n=1 Tax=Clostridium cavendishii DSM 21758 TaxID=1121302 RepID=A0A1M6NQH9_9CLOT|nr:CidA/LrgA family protein [Clostridium cavendishii]SHJ97969.1 holin-like protein [Clostridium cavendishii DSM 21758]
MKLLRELLIILAIYFAGEIIAKGLNLPVPGNIIGMILLLILLCTNIVKLNMIETVSKFFLDHLAFFFIPAGVGLLTSIAVIKDSFGRLLLVCTLTTIITIGVTALVVDLMTRKKSSNILKDSNDKTEKECA